METQIKELMGLVDCLLKAEIGCELAYSSDIENDERMKAREARKEIESKLRTMLERKTITDKQIAEATRCDIDDPVFLIFKGVVKAVERYRTGGE